MSARQWNRVANLKSGFGGQEATVTRANFFSADDWGKTFNGYLNPDHD